jgi:formate hydrogenlyase transcriptional activator
MRSLVRYSWPGNIREYKTVLRAAKSFSADGVFEPAPLERCEPAPAEIHNPTLEDTVRQEIFTACQRTNWKLGGPRGAAARVGLQRTTLFYKMNLFGITPPEDNWQG